MKPQEEFQSLCDAATIVAMTISRGAEGLTIQLDLETTATGAATSLRFYDVDSLAFRNNGRQNFAGIVHMMASDISGRGLERARFVVKDYEEEFLTFFCQRIDEVNGLSSEQ
ncbi:MAG: hypothetical protein ABI461_23330 [Polyangiaceae bacterium]